MKKSDLNKLEQCAELYNRIEALLDKAYDSIDEAPAECIYYGSAKAPTRISTAQLVNDMLIDASNCRKWIEHRVRDIREQLLK